MSLSLQEIYQETKEKYKLTLLAGSKSLSNIFSWVHMVEDPSVADFFYGQELVVTSGMTADDAEGLLEIVDILIRKNASGLILNIGRYFMDVPPVVITHCEKNNFPLLCMPWKSSMSELVRDYCSRIFQDRRREEDIAAAVSQAILAPHNVVAYRDILLEYFNPDLGFQMMVFNVTFSDHLTRLRVVQQTAAQIRNVLNHYRFQYLLFRYEQHFVLLANEKDLNVISQAAARIASLAPHSEYVRTLHIGVSDRVYDMTRLRDNYLRAHTAAHMALLRDQPVLHFRDMGIYKVLFTVADMDVLNEYYQETLAPLLDYDQKHNSNYTQTLLDYIRLNCSVNAVAEATFTHRNTINYRIRKIKDLLNSELDTSEARFPYLLDYYISTMQMHRDT